MIYDDGTLDKDARGALTRLFPRSRYIEKLDAAGNLDLHLPAGQYPALRERWANYPHIRKLIDPHLGSRGWKLVLDSDLLFFRSPDFVLTWMDRPEFPLHCVDCESSYGYSRTAMNELAGNKVAELVNVGLTGLKSEEIDWGRLEHWCSALLAGEGTNYYLEQALVAMVVAGRDCAVAPAIDYVTLPRRPEVDACRAVMHHYVAGSKRWYFQRNWRRALADIS